MPLRDASSGQRAARGADAALALAALFLLFALGVAVSGLVAQPRPGNSQVDFSRNVTVMFDARSDASWTFQPSVASLRVHPGELAMVTYRFHNLAPRRRGVQAVPSYRPPRAAAFFGKVECFCFREQALAAGESRNFPVVFSLDPKLPADVTTIRLSYTFFEVVAGDAGVLPAASAP